MMIGKGKKSMISLPKDNGIYLNALERKLEAAKAEKKKWAIGWKA